MASLNVFLGEVHQEIIMKQLPALTIVIITYNRRAELKQTLQALYDNLYYDDERITYLIADDCTPGAYRDDVLHDFKEINFLNERIEFLSTPQNSGWGSNSNHALSHVKDDVVLFLEDDRVLTEPLDISPYVALLMQHTGIGLVRLDGIGGHKTVLHTTETDISDYLPNYRQGMGAQGKLNYFLIDQNSPELWCYSNQPHLKHRRFHEWYGMYPEGLKLGQTEEIMAHTVKDGMKMPNAPALAVSLDATSKWDHIGRSFQGTEHDRLHEITDNGRAFMQDHKRD